jgi:3-hydroxybutyryl-CoA dehydratase
LNWLGSVPKLPTLRLPDVDSARNFYVQIGDNARFSKTIGESDVYLYAGLTGDFSPNHMNEAEMRKTAYGRRMAHGAMLIGFMSTTSTIVAERAGRDGAAETPVSLGYDRVRFIAPVFIGDTITVEYKVAAIDLEKRRALSDVTVINDRGDTVAVGQHILKWVPRS